MSKLKPHLPQLGGSSWTGRQPLPGGNFPRNDAAGLVKVLLTEHPFLQKSHVERLVRAYGDRARLTLGGARSVGGLGQIFVADLTEREVEYLMDNEWAHTAEDVLWRRSKLGLHTSDDQRQALADFMDRRAKQPAKAQASPVP